MLVDSMKDSSKDSRKDSMKGKIVEEISLRKAMNAFRGRLALSGEGSPDC